MNEKPRQTESGKNKSRETHRHYDRQKTVSLRKELFSAALIPEESKKIIENFDEIVADVRGLSGKQKVSLYGAIKNLSHQLTDERPSRRLGYMNEASKVSAYISYFMWWNLVRLVRLFTNLPKSAFNFGENAVAIDIGSGPLTVVTALWLARPELRTKKIKWYCMDLSASALSQGEELYLSIASRTIAATNQGEPWAIIRVKGALGTSIKEKADLITSANTFNEIIQNNEMPTDFLAKKYSGEIENYFVKNAEKNQTVLLVEPGDPHSARFVSLMRDAFIRRDFLPASPCTHTLECPMTGRTGGNKNGKWCNFAFSTDDAPAKLLKLSEKAGLPKERAVLSYILSQRKSSKEESDGEKHLEKESKPNSKFFIRITSDFIRLPEMRKSGYYACSEYGLLLAVDDSHIQPKNGELLQIKTPGNLNNLPIDQKSGALMINI